MSVGSSFRHEALFYSGAEGFLAGTVPFLQEGLAGGDAILVVESAAKIDALRTSLGADADAILFGDMAEVGANPARIIPAWRAFVSEYGGDGRRLRGIGEPIWQERVGQELIECQRHESLLNVAFAAGDPWHLLCPYDVETLPAEVIDEARRSHAFTTDGRSHETSTEFRGVAESAMPSAVPLPEPLGEVETMAFRAENLFQIRLLLGRMTAAAGLGRERSADFVMAVNEVATESLQHGSGRGALRIWTDGGQVTCEVADSGYFDDPLADRVRPEALTAGPRGLWLANQLCDLIQLRSGAAGTVVRLHIGKSTTH